MHAFSFASNDARYRVVPSFTDVRRYLDTLQLKHKHDDLAKRGILERLSGKRLTLEDKRRKLLLENLEAGSTDWQTAHVGTSGTALNQQNAFKLRQFSRTTN